jgi:hypothetical protein
MPRTDEKPLTCPICEMMNRAKDSETLKHLRGARREMLLAMKSVIEAGLACLDAKEKKPEQARKVEVS